nr:unnamed protein product [Digitaria exilis]
MDDHVAPLKHPVPAAYEDAWAALCWAVSSCCTAAGSGPGTEEPWLSIHGDVARLFVAGDSAGANIAHNMALRSGGGGGLPGGARIEGMVLLHPYFRGEELVPSEGTDPTFLEKAERSWGFLSGGRYGLDHPSINPLAMPPEEWAKLGCRRALVTVAERDTLRDRGRRYVEALRGSGWDGEEVVLYETEGEGHVYFIDKSGGGGDEKAKKEMATVVSFIRQHD